MPPISGYYNKFKNKITLAYLDNIEDGKSMPDHEIHEFRQC